MNIVVKYLQVNYYYFCEGIVFLLLLFLFVFTYKVTAYVGICAVRITRSAYTPNKY